MNTIGRAAIRTLTGVVASLMLMGQTVNTIGYTYDSLGRLTAAEYPNSMISYSYDNAGNRTTQAIVPPIMTCSNRTSWNFTYSGQKSITCSDSQGHTYSITAINSVSGPPGFEVSFSGATLTLNQIYAAAGSFSFSFVVTDTAGNVATGLASGYDEGY